MWVGNGAQVTAPLDEGERDSMMAGEGSHPRDGELPRATLVVDDSMVVVEAEGVGLEVLEAVDGAASGDLIGSNLTEIGSDPAAVRLAWRDLLAGTRTTGSLDLRGADGAPLTFRYEGSAGVGRDRHRLDLALDGRDAAGSFDVAGALTEREAEVLALLADGLNGPEIANRLGISPETVKSHAGNLKLRLGARTLAHAVSIGYRRGLLR